MSGWENIGTDAAVGTAIAPGIGTAIGAGVGILGDVLGFMGGQSTNAMQMQLAQQQMAFQRDMATHAMQYRVADLKAAGLNPMLAVSGGGAQAMPGAMAQLQNPAASFGQAGQQVTSAMQLQTQQAQIDLMKQQAKQAGATADYTSGPQSRLTGEQAGLAAVQSKVADATARFIDGAQTDAAYTTMDLQNSERERIQQQIESGDIAATVKLIGAQTTAQGAMAYMDRAIGQFNAMGAIEKHYGMQFFIQQLGTQVQLLKLQLPEAQAVANYYSTKMGQLSFAQRQVQSGIQTGLDVFKAFKPTPSISSPYSNPNPDFGFTPR